MADKWARNPIKKECTPCLEFGGDYVENGWYTSSFEFCVLYEQQNIKLRARYTVQL